jgi:hypothetical protein
MCLALIKMSAEKGVVTATVFSSQRSEFFAAATCCVATTRTRRFKRPSAKRGEPNRIENQAGVVRLRLPVGAGLDLGFDFISAGSMSALSRILCT